MFRLVRYRIKQILREKGLMFWGLCFPILMGTFFHIAFGNLGTENFEDVPAALVSVSENQSFSSYLEELDGSLLKLSPMEEEEALSALKDGRISGVFYIEEIPSLTVAGTGMEETLLSSLMDGYTQNAAVFSEIAKTHPENLSSALETLTDYHSFTKTTSLGGRTYDSTLEYFFALIAMACFYGTFLGSTLANENTASFSTLGARRSIAPVSKLRIISADMAAGVLIHFASVLLLLAYLRLVLGVELSGNPGLILLITFLGRLTGVSLGAAIGVSRLKEGFQTLLDVVIPLAMCFLAGLMVSGMRQLIEESAPVINRINPAALISDSFYCLTVYEDPERLAVNLVTLAAISLGLTLYAFLRMRRERYDSI